MLIDRDLAAKLGRETVAIIEAEAYTSPSGRSGRRRCCRWRRLTASADSFSAPAATRFYDLPASGDRLLFISRSDELSDDERHLRVVVNWAEDLRRLLAK